MAFDFLNSDVLMPDLPLFKSRYGVPLHFLFELFTGREKSLYNQGLL